eukprot:4271554-Amphidinium_carterae.1
MPSNLSGTDVDDSARAAVVAAICVWVSRKRTVLSWSSVRNKANTVPNTQKTNRVGGLNFGVGVVLVSGDASWELVLRQLCFKDTVAD